MTLVFSAPTVIALLKAKDTDKDDFTRRVVVGGMGVPKADADRTYPVHGQDSGEALEFRKAGHATMIEFLLSSTAVNALTSKFMEKLDEELAKAECTDDWAEINLVDWVRVKMFSASVVALMGSRIVEMIPDFNKMYWWFDNNLLAMFYGIPKFIKPEPYIARQRILDGVEGWMTRMLDDCGGEPSLEGEWEPSFGAKVIRARQRMFIKYNLSMRARAGLELGFLFG